MDADTTTTAFVEKGDLLMVQVDETKDEKSTHLQPIEEAVSDYFHHY